jgi:hypothetical protein
MLDGPQAVEAQLVGKLGDPHLAGVHLLIGQVLVQIAEPEVDSDMRHRWLLRCVRPVTASMPRC